MNAHEIADEIVNPDGYADDAQQSDALAAVRDKLEAAIREAQTEAERIRAT